MRVRLKQPVVDTVGVSLRSRSGSSEFSVPQITRAVLSSSEAETLQGQKVVLPGARLGLHKLLLGRGQFLTLVRNRVS